MIFTPPLFALRASEPRSNAIRSIETSRVHHASWRRGSVAARGARATGGIMRLAISHKLARTRPSVRRLQCPSWVGCTTKIIDREFPQGQGLKTSGTRSFRDNVNWFTPTLRLACYFLNPGLDARAWGDSGDLVSQRREKPSARSQASFDRDEVEIARGSRARFNRTITAATGSPDPRACGSRASR